MSMEYENRLNAHEWEVRSIDINIGLALVIKYHYAKGASNTATYLHGLFKKGSLWDSECMGVAWWIPPTKSAAIATYPKNWKGVLSLSRLVLHPDVPKNGATFLIARSMKLINGNTWPCLVTYADGWQGHSGGIYKASNWNYIGLTKPESVWTLNGRMISRKAGPKTRTKADMEKLGAVMVGRFSKHKFVHIVQDKRRA